MDCYTGLIEEFMGAHPDATSEEVWAYVDNYRAAQAEACDNSRTAQAETRQGGDDR